MNYSSTIGNIESYFPLVEKIVRSEARKLSIQYQTIEDLRSFGMEGLMGAMRNFDPNRGIPFEAYACKRIRWAVYDGLRTMGWFSRHTLAKIRFYRKADEMLEAQSNDPAPADKTEAVHRLSNTVRELASAYVVSYCEGEQRDEKADEHAPEEIVDRKRLYSALKTYILSLPEKEKFIVQRFFFEDCRLTEIANQMNITVSWASKLLSSALRHLRILFEKRPDLK
jgi:RNA polymerase sigma factor FliA